MIKNKNYLPVVCITAAIIMLAAILPELLYPAIGLNDIVSTFKKRKNRFELTAITYHDITSDKRKASKYVVHTSELENDFKYIKSHGYTTVLPDDIEKMRTDKSYKIPPKPILITFDDGYESFYRYAYPLLREYNLKAVVSIIGEQTDHFSQEVQTVKRSKRHLTWEQIAQMNKSGRVYIGNHTYNMHKSGEHLRHGVGMMQGETTNEYANHISADIGRLSGEIEQHIGTRCNTFAYPYGDRSKESDMILSKLGYKFLFTSDEYYNFIEKGKSGVLVLGRYNRSGLDKSGDFFSRIVR